MGAASLVRRKAARASAAETGQRREGAGEVPGIHNSNGLVPRVQILLGWRICYVLSFSPHFGVAVDVSRATMLTMFRG